MITNKAMVTIEDILNKRISVVGKDGKGSSLLACTCIIFARDAKGNWCAISALLMTQDIMPHLPESPFANYNCQFATPLVFPGNVAPHPEEQVFLLSAPAVCDYFKFTNEGDVVCYGFVAVEDAEDMFQHIFSLTRAEAHAEECLYIFKPTTKTAFKPVIINGGKS